MSLTTITHSWASAVVLAAGMSVSGCALGPIASMTDSDEPNIHSRNCVGLAIELHEHATRIATLQGAIKTELANPPATLVQAMKRTGDNPETGTSAYVEMLAERSRLATTELAANALHCPTAKVATSQ